MQSELETICNKSITSLLDAVKAEVVLRDVKTVGLLASPSTINTGLYSHTLKDQQLTIVTPAAHEQQQLEVIIRRVINGEMIEHSQLQPFIQRLHERGAEVIILGCTELSVIFDGKLPREVIDPLTLIIPILFGEQSRRNNERS